MARGEMARACGWTAVKLLNMIETDPCSVERWYNIYDRTDSSTCKVVKL